MAHELEIVNGEAQMFYVGKTPWHNLGKQLDNPPTVREAIYAAGLDWDVSMEKSFRRQEHLNGFDYYEVPETKFVVRATDNKVLGTVGNTYKPLQNTEAFEWFQPFLDTKMITLESAGSLMGGKRIWVLAKVKRDPLIVKADDTIECYILLANSHDGSLAITAGYTPIRVVCNNTLHASVEGKSSKLAKVRHTTGVKQTLDVIRSTMDLVNRTFEMNLETYQYLANRTINGIQFEKYIKTVFEQTSKDDKELSTKFKNQFDRLMMLWTNGKGNDHPSVKYTAWTAYNAVTEYLSHEAGYDENRRYNSLWFGKNASRNKVALEKAVKLVA